MALACRLSCWQLIDRFDVGLLIESRMGLAQSPDRLTELIKKIGGFRIGSLPEFRFAHDSGDFTGTLRRLAPYAGTILARVGKSADEKPAVARSDKTPYDLTGGLEAILAVGYQHAICLDHAGGPNAEKAIIAARETIESALTAEAENDAETDAETDAGGTDAAASEPSTSEATASEDAES